MRLTLLAILGALLGASVAAPSRAQAPGPDAAALAEDGSTLVNVLRNDASGPANESDQHLSVQSVGTPAHGAMMDAEEPLRLAVFADIHANRQAFEACLDSARARGAVTVPERRASRTVACQCSV